MTTMTDEQALEWCLGVMQGDLELVHKPDGCKWRITAASGQRVDLQDEHGHNSCCWLPRHVRGTFELAPVLPPVRDAAALERGTAERIASPTARWAHKESEAPALAAGTLWCIPGRTDVLHVLEAPSIRGCRVAPPTGVAVVDYRFRGDTKTYSLRVDLGAYPELSRHWVYVGKLDYCDDVGPSLPPRGAQPSRDMRWLCERGLGHDGDHWHHACGSWFRELKHRPSFAEVSRVPRSLERAIAMLRQDRGSLSAQGARRLGELLKSLRDVVFATVDAAQMQQLEESVFGELHDVCRPLLGTVFMVFSGGASAESWQEKGLLEGVERLLASEPVYNARLALHARKQGAKPLTRKAPPEPGPLVVDHGWDEPSEWTGKGPGILRSSPGGGRRASLEAKGAARSWARTKGGSS